MSDDPTPEPPGFTARFDKIEHDHGVIKKALGVLMVALVTKQLALPEDLAAELGLKATHIVPATRILGS